VPAMSAELVLAVAGKSSVTTIDIQGDALRIPAESRKTTLTNADAVQQLANNLVLRRALASEAEAEGLAEDPAVQSAIRIARERVLSDLLIARLDAANKPSRQAAEALAQTLYKANPKRFDLPSETGARHIIIKKETPDAKAKALAVLAELKAGADFEAMAKKHSEDVSASAGGNLGYFPAGQMVPEFEAALDKMRTPGELSDLVETRFGFHIIKLEGRRSAGVRSYEQVKDLLVREAEAKILADRRLGHIRQIQDTVVVDKAAIEAFAESNN
jgi:peptidyl-prolyl cis-trans isomerase C